MKTQTILQQLVTKSINILDTDRRIFEGILSAEVIDKQNEVMFVDELMKVLPIWMARGGSISDTHTNKIVGKGINYMPVEITDKDGNTIKGVKIVGQIYADWQLDHQIWDKIKDGTYRGLSFGGATTGDRIPLKTKDGRVAYGLQDLQQWEVAVCEDPAVPIAVITDFNSLAKSVDAEVLNGMNIRKLDDGKVLVRCKNATCYIEHEDNGMLIKGTNLNKEQIQMAEDESKKTKVQKKDDDEEDEKEEKTAKKEKKADTEEDDEKDEKLEEVKGKKDKSVLDVLLEMKKSIDASKEEEKSWKEDVEKTLIYLVDKIDSKKAMETPTDKPQGDNTDAKLNKKPYDNSEQRGDETPAQTGDKVHIDEKKSTNVEVTKTAGRPDDDSKIPEDITKGSGGNRLMQDLRKGSKTMDEVTRSLLFGDYGDWTNTLGQDPEGRGKLGT